MLDSCYSINILLLIGATWCMLWWFYNYCIRSPTCNPLGTILMHVPPWIQKLTPKVSSDPKKNNTKLLNIDGWSIGHFLIYTSIGLFFQGKYAEVLLISLLCETYEYMTGWRARWLLDPAVNLLGYTFGTFLETQFQFNLYNKLKHVHTFQKLGCTFTFISVLVIILFMNRPKFMKYEMFE